MGNFNNNRLNSLEVAQMVGKRHTDLLRDIRGYIKHMQNDTERKIALSEFFIESTYVDSTGRALPRFDVTRKGCEFIGNKLTGQKGTLFTATYINRFHEMEQQQEIPINIDPAALNAVTKFINTMSRIMERRGDVPQKVIEMAALTCRKYNIPLPLDFEKNPMRQNEQLTLSSYPDILS